jgi:hypothetical protein
LAAYLLIATASHSQPGDTPITVSDGSLYINSPNLNASWTNTNDDLYPPNQAYRIRNVEVVQGSATQYNGPCGSPQCTIDISYGRGTAKGSLRIHSNANSQSGLHINRNGLPPFPQWTKTDANTLSNEPTVHDSIARVTVAGGSYCTGQGKCTVTITYASAP